MVKAKKRTAILARFLASVHSQTRKVAHPRKRLHELDEVHVVVPLRLQFVHLQHHRHVVANHHVLLGDGIVGKVGEGADVNELGGRHEAAFAGLDSEFGEPFVDVFQGGPVLFDEDVVFLKEIPVQSPLIEVVPLAAPFYNLHDKPHALAVALAHSVLYEFLVRQTHQRLQKLVANHSSFRVVLITPPFVGSRRVRGDEDQVDDLERQLEVDDAFGHLAEFDISRRADRPDVSVGTECGVVFIQVSNAAVMSLKQPFYSLTVLNVFYYLRNLGVRPVSFKAASVKFLVHSLPLARPHRHREGPLLFLLPQLHFFEPGLYLQRSLEILIKIYFYLILQNTTLAASHFHLNAALHLSQAELQLLLTHFYLLTAFQLAPLGCKKECYFTGRHHSQVPISTSRTFNHRSSLEPLMAQVYIGLHLRFRLEQLFGPAVTHPADCPKPLVVVLVALLFVFDLHCLDLEVGRSGIGSFGDQVFLLKQKKPLRIYVSMVSFKMKAVHSPILPQPSAQYLAFRVIKVIL